MEDILNQTADLWLKFEEVQTAYKVSGGTIRLTFPLKICLILFFEDHLLPIKVGRKSYLLMETPYYNPPIGLHDILKRIQQKGYYPLLAHPERYEYMSAKDYQILTDMGVLFQLNIPALSGMYGRGVRRKEEKLLKAKLYDFVECNVHSERYYQYIINSKIYNQIDICYKNYVM